MNSGIVSLNISYLQINYLIERYQIVSYAVWQKNTAKIF